MQGPRIDDAFGKMLKDCLEKQLESGRIFEVVERSDGLINIGDPLRYFSAVDQWPTIERWGCTHVRGRVLDIGAGAGRHTLYLQQEGHVVVALDPSPLAIETSKLRGVERLIVGTIETVAETTTERFDTFLLLGNNLGLLRDRQYATAFLDHLAAISNRDAVVIAHGANPYLTQDPVHLEYQEQNHQAGRMPGQVTMRVRYGRLATEWFDYLFLSVEELSMLLKASQWQIVDLQEDGASYVAILRRSK